MRADEIVHEAADTRSIAMTVQRRPPRGTKLKKGQRPKWVVRYRPYPGAKKSVSFTYAEYDAPEAAANAYYAQVMTDLNKGTWIDPELQKITVGELVSEWQDSADRPGTYRQRKMLVDNLGALEDMPIASVRAHHIKAWMSALRRGRPWADGAPLAESTVDNKFGQLRSIFSNAVDDGLLAVNPMKHSSLRQSKPKGMKSVQEAEVPSVADIRALISHAETGGEYEWSGDRVRVPRAPWMALCIKVATETGLRPGEVAGLLGRDVDVKNRIIRVRQQCGNRLMVHGKLKTESSERDVPISRALAQDLDAVLRGPNDAAIPGPAGRGTSSGSISAFFPDVRRMAGVSEKITFHGCRHFYATSLLEGGESLHTVAALLGHDEISTTDRVYAHFQPGRFDASRAAIDSIAGSLRDEGPKLRAI